MTLPGTGFRSIFGAGFRRLRIEPEGTVPPAKNHNAKLVETVPLRLYTTPAGTVPPVKKAEGKFNAKYMETVPLRLYAEPAETVPVLRHRRYLIAEFGMNVVKVFKGITFFDLDLAEIIQLADHNGILFDQFQHCQERHHRLIFIP